MRILLTGAAGFVGSHLAERLLADGHEVVGVDNLRTGRRAHVELLAERAGFSFIEHDVSEPLLVDGALDAVLHFASPASPTDFEKIPIPILKANAVGAWHTLGLAKAKGARYLLASTSEVYGDPLEHPQTERYWGHVNPIGIRGVYDESKRFAEAMTMAYHRTHGIDTRIVRIFNTYGARMREDDGRALPAFVWAAVRSEPLVVFGDGSQTRSFCAVDDLVRGVVALLAMPDEEHVHDPVNLGNPGEFTIAELAALIVDLSGSTSEIVFGPLPQDDPERRKPDIARARALLGWEPTIALRDGLPPVIDAFRARNGPQG